MPAQRQTRVASAAAAHPSGQRVSPNSGTTGKLTLGGVVRSLRQQRNWTLKEMSLRTGIPFSTLSKVENDRLTLTYEKLLQLAERLNMRLSDLFAEPQPADASATVIARRSIGSVKSAMRIETPNYDLAFLCAELRKKRAVPVLTRVRARNLEEFGPLSRHSGEEWAYILEGQVVVHTEYYDPVTLDVGEVIYLDSGMGHAYVLGEGHENALMIGSWSGSGEDHHDELPTVHT